MGWLSPTVPGMVQSDSPESSLPIENSPPGIQAMPSGAGPGGAAVLGIVAAKSEGGAAGAPAVFVHEAASSADRAAIASDAGHRAVMRPAIIAPRAARVTSRALGVLLELVQHVLQVEGGRLLALRVVLERGQPLRHVG